MPYPPGHAHVGAEFEYNAARRAGRPYYAHEWDERKLELLREIRENRSIEESERWVKKWDEFLRERDKYLYHK